LKFDEIKNALLSVLPNPTSHYYAKNKTALYIVWAEDAAPKSQSSDNKIKMITVQGTIDFFTKTEYDPIADQIQEALNNAGIGWKLNSIQHEEDTELIHYEWVWEVNKRVGKG